MIEAKVIKDSISDHGVRLLTEREIALEQGYKRYLGKICKKHNKRERWVCNNICVKCSREYAHKYMPSYIKRNQDRLQARRKRWTLDNPEKSMMQRARRRARQLGISFEISVNEIVIPELCPVLNIVLDRHISQDNAPSLDRIDNSKGYVTGNVVVISHRANRIKSDSILDELIALVNFYQNQLKEV